MRLIGASSRRPAKLLQTASVLVLGTLATGCAGNIERFTDSFYTEAVPVRPPQAVQTPYPEPRTASAQSGQTHRQTLARSGGIDPSTTGSIRAASAAAAPAAVTRQPMAAPRPAARQAEATAAAPAPSRSEPVAQTPAVRTVSAPPAAAEPQQVARAAPADPPAQPASASGGEAGWTGTGGTYVTLRQGETIYNLTKRYGVPVDAIMRVNKLSDARSVQAGQRILIPTYVYDRSVPVSAPDANAGVRSARASVGGRTEFDLKRAPVPRLRPQIAMASEAPNPPAQTAAAAPANSGPKGGRYTVAAGDTLSAISRRTGASIEAIKRTNGLNGDMVRIGQSLIIPGLDGGPAPATEVAAANVDPVVTSSVQRVDTRPQSPSNARSVTAIDQSSTASAPAATGVSSMRWPARGRIIAGFGSNAGGRPNDGIDISVPKGTPVKAAENGVVIYAGDGLKEFGKTVLVRHSDGVVTVYGHLSEMSAARGDTVQRGQTIGASGMSGNARQPQLHFEVRKDATPVDPLTYLN